MPITIETISLDEARQALDAIIGRASADGGGPVAVCVVGVSGRPIAFAAMDHVAPASIKLSQSKAYSAVIGQRDTLHWALFPKNADTVDFDMRNWTDADFSGFTGGVVIVKETRVIGGIGVSGRKGKRGSEDTIMQDHELATHGKNILTNKFNGHDEL